MPEALPELVPLALLFLCFAFVWAARKLLAAMFGAVIDAVNAAHIPYLGGYIHDGLHAMEQAIDNALGSVENGIDSLMGSCWHRFAQLNNWLWDEFKNHSLIGSLTAQLVGELTHGYHYLHNIALGNTQAHAHDAARIKSLEREYRGIEGQVKTLERDYSHGIGHDVLPRLKTLEREAARIENVQLPAAIAAQRQADSAISNLYDWAKGKASLIGVGTFSFAVAVALDALGLAALKCTNFKNLLGRFGCGLGTLLNDLLGLAIAGIALESVCEFLPEVEAAFGAVAGPMVHILNEVPLGACETVPDGWATLTVKRGPLPPRQTLGRLAA